VVKVRPRFAFVYAGEIAKIVRNNGAGVRALLAPEQCMDDAVTIVVQSPDCKSYGVEYIDFAEISSIEIDGPRHPCDLST
jgi:hypothetical protein